MNVATLQIPWEQPGQAPLEPGPIDEYLEVIDIDPATGACYAPVDLDHRYLLAQDGLPPSEGNPQFHQQMVYAVARKTIAHFEQALGRVVLWSPRRIEKNGDPADKEFVRRLRIYPHALREANAYYSPEKRALLFGYFPASTTDPGRLLPGGMVFTCLSHDVVAHETTHALLDGLHRRFVEASNPDSLAFHEAFADIVALFQHFTFPEAVRHQIAHTRGDLASQNLLAELAQQFGQAIGNHGALRSAIDDIDPKTGRPDPNKYLAATEPHDRGAILVAAVFDAFLSIYKTRIADLLRIATSGSGVLPEGQLHPDLVNRLAAEANKAALHVLRMCIRALDYCPPVDMTFGEYLRALVTADYDLVPDDDLGYRIAIVEAFRLRGIYPTDVRSLSTESLRWSKPTITLPIQDLNKLWLQWKLGGNREEIHNRTIKNQQDVERWVKDKNIDKDMAKQMGLAFFDDAPASIERSQDGLPEVEIDSVRPARRVGPDGQQTTDLVIEITQSRRGYFDPQRQKDADAGKIKDPGDFNFRGGCTLLIDMETGGIRYCIGKYILSEKRLKAQREYLSQDNRETLRATYFGTGRSGDGAEPFAMLHRDFERRA
ncbi:MAG: hypothetical protein NTU53_21845 [Planctomycetota bacterium]|nr:hypothetical protein [Planctomycetota bacterium]